MDLGSPRPGECPVAEENFTPDTRPGLDNKYEPRRMTLYTAPERLVLINGNTVMKGFRSVEQLEIHVRCDDYPGR